MSGKHMCQLRYAEKADLLNELQNAVARIDALQPKPQNKYAVDELPNFLRRKVPKFKKNLDLQPLITHTAVDEVRFTSDVEMVAAQQEDPHVRYGFVPGPGCPFKPTYATSDPLCKEFCDKAVDMDRMRKNRTMGRTVHDSQPMCLSQMANDAPKDSRGNFYDCDHNRKYEGMMVCNPKGHSQAYLCTPNVYPQNQMTP